MTVTGVKEFARQFAVDETAAGSAEFAIVIPLVLTLIFGAIASGVMMYTAVNMQRASEIAARCLSAQRTDCTPYEKFYKGPDVGVAINVVNNAPGCDGYRATASGTFNFFAGFALSVPVGTAACYPGPY